jgi:flagellar motility protein MotE (MotC chaperone)
MPPLQHSFTRAKRAHPCVGLGAMLAAVLAAVPAIAQESKSPDLPKPRPVAIDRNADDASRYCANIAPAIAEARIAWQTRRLAELDAQVRQRIADLEKAEASARDWIARRDEASKAATDDVVAIYGKMQAENAARQISAMDDRMAAAILGRLKPNAAAAIFSEMEADRASRLSSLIAAAPEKKS